MKKRDYLREGLKPLIQNIDKIDYSERNKAILKMYSGGVSQAELARVYKLSPNRVHAIIWAGIQKLKDGQ